MGRAGYCRCGPCCCQRRRELFALAEVRLPPSIRTAPAAEASAIPLAVVFSVDPPRIVTDGPSLLTTACAGAARATAACAPLAGVWNNIAASCGGDLQAPLPVFVKKPGSGNRIYEARLPHKQGQTLLRKINHVYESNFGLIFKNRKIKIFVI